MVIVLEAFIDYDYCERAEMNSIDYSKRHEIIEIDDAGLVSDFGRVDDAG